ncbi:hypothetical protein CAPTEDRAFT_188927 [Capitella teleta]|uniref:Uncharacterized protein n=1 Tax=Capitella teleta TaxID=283909 RepID=R7U4C5_CAPTE|nr:hypothetical protein CAPTEDRAFT_188927 [Capitella teleta]|eukprot:ELU00819.1 hypothetical protein CAPTEDRAFT_188927 [Capitella teleta]
MKLTWRLLFFASMTTVLSVLTFISFLMYHFRLKTRRKLRKDVAEAMPLRSTRPPRLQMYRKFRLNVAEFIQKDRMHRAKEALSLPSFDECSSCNMDITLSESPPSAKVKPRPRRHVTSTPITSSSLLTKRSNSSRFTMNATKIGKFGDIMGNRHREGKF